MAQVLSLVGAAIVLAAFTLMKLKRISPHGHTFDAMNLLGCVILLVTAVLDHRLGLSYEL